jgi:hypothetical protein
VAAATHLPVVSSAGSYTSASGEFDYGDDDDDAFLAGAAAAAEAAALKAHQEKKTQTQEFAEEDLDFDDAFLAACLETEASLKNKKKPDAHPPASAANKPKQEAFANDDENLLDLD